MTNPAYEKALTYNGTWEWKDGHNPVILKWFGTVGHDWVKDDETAWCAAFVGAMLEETGHKSTGALNARSYLDWGTEVSIKDAEEGDILVFTRGNPNGPYGHVGFLAGKKAGVKHSIYDGKIACFGGNQKNGVNFALYPVDRLLSIRKGDWDTLDEELPKRKSFLEKALMRLLRPAKSGVEYNEK